MVARWRMLKDRGHEGCPDTCQSGSGGERKYIGEALIPPACTGEGLVFISVTQRCGGQNSNTR